MKPTPPPPTSYLYTIGGQRSLSKYTKVTCCLICDWFYKLPDNFPIQWPIPPDPVVCPECGSEEVEGVVGRRELMQTTVGRFFPETKTIVVGFIRGAKGDN